MNYSLQPSLQHRCIVQIAITLLDADDVRFFCASHLEAKKFPIAESATENILRLPLKPTLKTKLLRVFHAVTSQLLLWMKFHYDYCDLAHKIPDEFYWTPWGTIDRKKMADMLIRDQNVDIAVRYRLACIYCLVDHIDPLWKQLGEGKFHAKNLRIIRLRETSLVAFWSHYTENKIAELGDVIRRYCPSHDASCYEYGFLRASYFGSEAGARYFLQRLAPEKKERVLVESVIKLTAHRLANETDVLASEHTVQKFCAEVLCFLLSVMTSMQQTKVFALCPWGILDYFLDWPLQDLFIPTTERMLAFLPAQHFEILLNTIVKKSTCVYADYDYRNLFKLFWQNNPPFSRKYVIDKCICEGKLLAKLAEAKDEENIKVIFANMSVKKRQRFMCLGGVDICQRLAQKDEWDLFKFLIQHCIPSKSAMTEFKSEFLQRVQLQRDKLENLMKILDDFDH